jgi:hypothetical protein
LYELETDVTPLAVLSQTYQAALNYNTITVVMSLSSTTTQQQTNYLRVLEINVVRVLFDRNTRCNPLLLFLDNWFGWIWPKSFNASRTLEDPPAHKINTKKEL